LNCFPFGQIKGWVKNLIIYREESDPLKKNFSYSDLDVTQKDNIFKKLIK